MAAQPQAGALIKARIEGKQGTHKIRVRALSDTEMSFVHEWASKGATVQGKKVYTLPLDKVEVVAVLEDRADRFVTKPGDIEKAEEPKQQRPRRRKATMAA